MSAQEAARGTQFRGQIDPLLRIERAFGFDGDMSGVTMGTWGVNSALCELQLRPEENVRLRGSDRSPLKAAINGDARRVTVSCKWNK